MIVFPEKRDRPVKQMTVCRASASAKAGSAVEYEALNASHRRRVLILLATRNRGVNGLQLPRLVGNVEYVGRLTVGFRDRGHERDRQRARGPEPGPWWRFGGSAKMAWTEPRASDCCLEQVGRAVRREVADGTDVNHLVEIVSHQAKPQLPGGELDPGAQIDCRVHDDAAGHRRERSHIGPRAGEIKPHRCGNPDDARGFVHRVARQS